MAGELADALEAISVARGVATLAGIPKDLGIIANITGENDFFKSYFTQGYVSTYRKSYPHRNVIVVHGPYNYALSNVRDLPYTLPLIGDTFDFRILIFDSGTFVRLGDGGFTNWAFGGNFTRGNPDEAHVTFYPIDPPPQENSPPRRPPPPPPPQVVTPPGKDGVYLVNSVKGNHISSGFAYYSELGWNNIGKQPTAYINVIQGKYQTWESHTIFGTFSDGDVFSSSVNSNAPSAKYGAPCGTASNKFRPMTIYKDDYKLLYEVNGWQVHAVYWAQ